MADPQGTPPESDAPDHRSARFRTVYAYALLTASMICWSTTWVIGRAIYEDISPIAITFFRWTVSALLLAPFAVSGLTRNRAALKRQWPLIALVSFSGLVLFQVGAFTGLGYTTAINSILMNSATPLIIIILASFVDKDRVSSRQLLGMAISFCGIVVVLSKGNISVLSALHFSIGDLIILASMPAWALYCVLLRRIARDFDTLTLLFLLDAFAAILLAPALLVENAYFRPLQFSWPALWAVLYIGGVTSCFAYLCWNRGIELVGPGRAGITMHLLPGFTALWAITFLGESLHAYHVIGIAVILSGVWLASSGRHPQQIS